MDEVGNHRFDADIRWTTHGVAHVRAADWGGLGFGQGWACARDQLPAIADQILKVRSERARFFGAGPNDSNLASDFGYLALDVVGFGARIRAAQPPRLRDLISGYVAGYNSRLTEAATERSLPAWCRDAVDLDGRGDGWIRPLSEADFYAHLADVTLMASGRNLAGLAGRAVAPGPDGPVAPSPAGDLGVSGGAASNGWAFGGDATESGGGLVMANPHFPWYGEARFWECHLTIPGELDVYGASLLGTPGVQIGFNSDVAWTHTFSAGFRFTVYRLDLVSGEPTSYRYGDTTREMTPRRHRIEVGEGAGAHRTLERTLWHSHYGPMLNMPLIGWGNEVGFTFRDANAANTRVIEQYVGMDTATDIDDLRSTFARVQGLPWVNTLAADRSGRCWYTDASATPAIDNAAQERFKGRLRDDLIAALLLENRVALLDGSDPGDEWRDHPGAPSPGVEPFTALPQLERRDVVVNANDSHWSTNPAAPLEGFNVLCGFERAPLSLRTRQNLRVATALAERGGVTLTSALEALLSNESLSAELLVDAVVERLSAIGGKFGTVDAGERPVDLGEVARILSAWDRRCNLDSVGTALWREIVVGFPAAALRDAGQLFAVPFDPDHPVATPHTLAAPASTQRADPLVRAVVAAVGALREAGVPLDARLDSVQWVMRGARRVGVHGGGEVEGTLNVLSPFGALPSTSLEPTPAKARPLPGREPSGLAAGGYPCDYGTSFLMAVELTAEGPVGIGLLAYGQSGDPDDPHHGDGTDAYVHRAPRPLLFDDADIEADPGLERRSVSHTG